LRTNEVGVHLSTWEVGDRAGFQRWLPEAHILEWFTGQPPPPLKPPKLPKFGFSHKNEEMELIVVIYALRLCTQ
jgi:hypothetical protein